MQTYKKPVYDAEGNPLYLIGVSVDVTERKISEKNLRALNEDLEKSIERRTRQLAVAKEIAEEASRIKSEFIANMSHEIRTPMNSVLGMAQLALKAEIDPKQRDYLKKIQISGEHLLGIIDSILDFSKIDAGKLKLECIDFDLETVIENLANLLVAKAEEKNLGLVFDIEPSIPHYLRGDPMRLSQVLINFTNNAIKFTEKGGIIIRLRPVTENEKSILLRFSVQDTGIGIVKAELPKLFQTFQQGDSSISRRYGGSGLGLAISKQLAILMGGEVGVESEAGKGSTFWLSVPFDKGSQPQLQPAQEHEQAVLAALRGARILLTEDNLFNQQVACEFLQDAGALVSVACNGEEALDLLSKQYFDCILMDIQMPVMDGLEATSRIRADATLAEIPVIAMSANVSNEDRERCRAIGMDDFINKPFKPYILYSTIAKWLSAQQSLFTETTVATPAKSSWTGDPDFIDLSILAEMMNGNPEKISDFAHRFIASTKIDVTEIEQALERGDMESLGSFAHRAKSPARMVGALGFANLCQTLEDCARKGSIEQAQKIVVQISPLLDRISRIIDNTL